MRGAVFLLPLLFFACKTPEAQHMALPEIALPELVPAAALPAPAKVDPFADLLTGAPAGKMRDAKAYILDPGPRIGIIFGLPYGWRYDDPSYLSIYKGAGRFAVLRLDDTALSADNVARILKRGVLPAQIKKATWGSWHDGIAGRQRWPAKIARGDGTSVRGGEGPLSVIAGVIDVPDTRAVGFVAAWPKAQPELEAHMLDIVRHLRRCKVRVGHGCEAEVALPES